jgi:hypothetical protein
MNNELLNDVLDAIIMVLIAAIFAVGFTFFGS